MKKVRLETSDGREVEIVDILPFLIRPEVIVWGSRFFRFHRQEVLDVYREAFTFAALDPKTVWCGHQARGVWDKTPPVDEGWYMRTTRPESGDDFEIMQLQHKEGNRYLLRPGSNYAFTVDQFEGSFWIGPLSAPKTVMTT